MSDKYIRLKDGNDYLNTNIAGIDFNNLIYSNINNSGSAYDLTYNISQDCFLCLFCCTRAGYPKFSLYIDGNLIQGTSMTTSTSGQDNTWYYYYGYLKDGQTLRVVDEGTGSGNKRNIRLYGLKF